MKSYWRRPFQFWNDYKLAVQNKQIPEPSWYKYVMKEPPGQHNILGKKPWPKISFPLDTYRRLYYRDYPHESMLYSHSVVPGEKKYLQSPMDIFLERHYTLTQQGVDPDMAYLQCQEEKEAREFTQELERFFCAQQAQHIYGLDPFPAPQNPGPTPYQKAKSYVEKAHRDRLERIIAMKRDSGDSFKITRSDLENMTQEEIYDFIRTHPEDAEVFDESVYFGDEAENVDTEGIDPPPYEHAVDPALETYFGLADHWNPLKYAGKSVEEVTNQDLQDIQADTLKMIDHMSIEMGVDLQSQTLYDVLPEQGRFEVLQAWSTSMPDSAELLEQPYYSSQMSKHLREYQQKVTDVPENQLKDATGSLKKDFANYQQKSGEIRANHSKYLDAVSKKKK